MPLPVGTPPPSFDGAIEWLDDPFYARAACPLLVQFWAISCPICKINTPGVWTVPLKRDKKLRWYTPKGKPPTMSLKRRIFTEDFKQRILREVQAGKFVAQAAREHSAVDIIQFSVTHNLNVKRLVEETLRVLEAVQSGALGGLEAGAGDAK